MFSRKKTGFSMKDSSNPSDLVRRLVDASDAVVIGAGAGLSVSAGFAMSGRRFADNFSDFHEKYGIQDMYSGGFYPFETLSEYWAWWSRCIFLNRYSKAPDDVYGRLLKLVEDRDYFVLTTNVDHQFQAAGFDSDRLFCTQGDYGLFQCSRPCHEKTYENRETVMRMVKEQKDMRVPEDLIPYCPACGEPMSMNLRCDDTFVEDAGWHEASLRYAEFLRRTQGKKVLFLELGVGMNTPVIIKYPFWRMTAANPASFYLSINLENSLCPDEIKDRALCIGADISSVI